MQVKHLLLLVVLILMIPPGFYWLMSSSTHAPETDPVSYEVVKTGPESISVKIRDDRPPLDTPYYQQFVEKLQATPSWLVGDANFQGCVTRAIENCTANTTQREVQLLQSDTLCDALPPDEATACKNQFYHTRAIRNKDIAECARITNQFQATACQNGVFTQKALESQNPRWCDKVVSAAGVAASADLISPEKQNCLNLLDLRRGAADSSFLNNQWEGGLQETVLD